MNKKETLKVLKNLYFEMERLKIPQNIENEQLSKWIDNFNELDPYYAGLALTVAEGGKVLVKELYDLGELKKKLNSIQVYKEQDKEILEKCKSYLMTIEKIDCLLRELSDNSIKS
jgi:hypothetical protein